MVDPVRYELEGQGLPYRRPPIAPSGLFSDAVNSVVGRYQEACKQVAEFQRFLPHRSVALGAAGREQPQPCTSSSYREV